MKKLGHVLFFLSALGVLAVASPSESFAQQQCLVNKYMNCRAGCRTKAWLRTPRRCKWMMNYRQKCVREYDQRFRNCHNRFRHDWVRKVRCFRRARNLLSVCYRYDRKVLFRVAANNLRWYCKSQCGDWRPGCVRRCVWSVFDHCDRWVTALSKNSAHCYNGCRARWCAW